LLLLIIIRSVGYATQRLVKEDRS